MSEIKTFCSLPLRQNISSPNPIWIGVTIAEQICAQQEMPRSAQQWAVRADIAQNIENCARSRLTRLNNVWTAGCMMLQLTIGWLYASHVFLDSEKQFGSNTPKNGTDNTPNFGLDGGTVHFWKDIYSQCILSSCVEKAGMDWPLDPLFRYCTPKGVVNHYCFWSQKMALKHNGSVCLFQESLFF